MKIVIVGGVAAGMSAAARARRLDEHAEIVVFERGEHVSFANCGLPYHIGGIIENRESLLLHTPVSLQAMLGLDVRTGSEVTAIDREKKTVTVSQAGAGREYDESYDKLVLCPGASPIRPPIPGIDHPKVFVLRDVADMDRLKSAVDGGAESAVVVGGGYIGVEVAENLRERGLDVDVVEMLDQIMAPLDPEIARELEWRLQSHGVRVNLGVAARAIREAGDGLRVEFGDDQSLEADFVVMSVGVRPDAKLAEAAGVDLGPGGGLLVDAHMRTSDEHIYAAGDAIELRGATEAGQIMAPLAGPANRQGRIAADNLCGRDSTFSYAQGTGIVKVFDMTAGGTGANEKTLKARGTPYAKAYLHPMGHAGYYPGTAQMRMKVTFSPEDGKLLGAQIAGYDGVDKRLDVLATAIRAGMTVYDLEELELAYAPPYGSAKDPVNMAGFIGANMLRGDVVFWYAEDFPEKTAAGTIVDVRDPDEFEVGHIEGAINVPLGKLRESLDSIPKDRPVFLYCKIGFRSYLAYRILKQSGFDEVTTLAGGSLTFDAVHGLAPAPQAAPADTDEQTGKPMTSPAQETTEVTTEPTGNVIELDCCGLQCPGPIRKLSEAAAQAAPGDEIKVCASDPGFATDVPVWCRKQGFELLDVSQDGPRVEAHLRKLSCVAAPTQVSAVPVKDKKTMVIFSGDLDKVLAGFVIANGAAAMGSEVTMFFTFWGLNALRKAEAPWVKKPVLDAMFGKMMPKGARKLKLSNMNMAGMGTAMMKHVMSQKNVDSLPDLMKSAQEAGVKLVACSMSMDIMGITREELIDDVEIGGVAAFLGESDEAGMTLFI